MPLPFFLLVGFWFVSSFGHDSPLPLGRGPPGWWPLDAPLRAPSVRERGQRGAPRGAAPLPPT